MADTKPEAGQIPEPPQIVLEQAHAAAQGNQESSDTEDRPADNHPHHPHHGSRPPHLDHVPPAPYNSAAYGQLDISQNGLETGAKLAKDGRINININQHSNKLSSLLVPALRRQLDLQKREAAQEPPIPEGLGETDGLPPPPMNIVIQIVGSRGDVQPFVALGQVLKNKFNHRVRIATHPTFQEFVTDNGLEFFSIGGDPAELMAFMVKNPGLMPGMDSLKSGDVGKRRKGIYEIVTGCWRSCMEAGDGTGIRTSDEYADLRSFDSAISFGDPTQKPFIVDAIIANPPSFAHVHIAEKLGIPLHLMFTMPWSPTQQFPHPLANIISSNADPNMANFISYALVDMLTWQGLGDVINKFRERSLGLEPVSIMWAPGMASRLRIPWTYCWSPALIPKPLDWGNYIDISGFYFLNLASDYTPPQDLAEFLEAGPPPLYIGFGSIVVDDPNAMTKMIFEAVKQTGQRALVSKGWGGLGADALGIPEGVFMLGNCPHDWLFQKVSCVVHHGGAGTTATGISAGRPTVVVPFFGDQPFWGAMCARAGAGPMPIPYKNLTADKLASQILEALKPESLAKAEELSARIKQERGTEAGADSFHKQLRLADLRCSVAPERVAVWRVKRTDIRLSTLAATVLGSEGLIDFTDLKLYRPREYETEDGPWEPISGGAAALIGTIGSLSMGVADFPVEIFKSLKGASHDVKAAHEKHKSSPSASGTGTPVTSSTHPSTSDLSKNPPVTSPRSSLSEAHAVEKQDSNVSDLNPTPTVNDDASIRSGSKGTSLSTVMSPDGEPRHPRRHGSWSSRSQRSRSRSPYQYGEDKPCPAEDAAHITVESAVGGAKAAGKIVSAGMKSPMEFTLSLAKGFHNAPKLYGDTTVRKSEKITDLQSGLKAAGKEFGFGFYDGITGLVTQPVAGARKEGAAGFIKGAAKGFGGLILKPGAAIWGLPGYTAKGVYAELAKHFGSSVQNYIIAARTAQGFEEWKNTTPEQRADIVTAWNSSKLEERKKGHKYGQEREHEIETHILSQTHTDKVEMVHGFKNTRRLNWDERKALAARKEEVKQQEKELKKREVEMQRERTVAAAAATEAGAGAAAAQHGFGRLRSRLGDSASREDNSLKHATSFPNTSQRASYGRSSDQERVAMDEDKEFEEAIHRSVTETSKGDPKEDDMIAKALRASLMELRRHEKGGSGWGADYGHDEEAYKKALGASIREAKRVQMKQRERARTLEKQETGTTGVEEHHDDDGESMEHERELHRALTQSLDEYKAKQGAEGGGAPPPAYHQDGQQQQHSEDNDSGLGMENDEELKKTLEESKRLHTENEERRGNIAAMAAEESSGGNAAAAADDEHDEELKKAMTASTEEQGKFTREKTEEEIVLDYVKKQSLLEAEHKRNVAA